MRACALSQELRLVQKELETWERIQKDVEGLFSVAQSAEDDGWSDTALSEEIQKEYDRILEEYEREQFLINFSGKYDSGNALLSVHAGTGGIDAQDFAQMLLRMYLRYAERKGWNTSFAHETRGAEAGIKSATIEILGEYAYGFLRTEAGVHRLVRISPFDAEKMRHTSFALVEVLPVIPEVGEIELNEKDLKFQASTSRGAGGQSVNTTYSAIKITHIPSGINVSCQNERSQSQNKATALKILRARVYDYMEKKRKGILKEIQGTAMQAKWSNQIRSYVLQPYRMVKDHRTEMETADTQKFLDGDIDAFIQENVKKLGRV